MYLNHALTLAKGSSPVDVLQGSAVVPVKELYDVILTDPPYYDAIPYSDLMDFFYSVCRKFFPQRG